MKSPSNQPHPPTLNCHDQPAAAVFSSFTISAESLATCRVVSGVVPIHTLVASLSIGSTLFTSSFHFV